MHFIKILQPGIPGQPGVDAEYCPCPKRTKPYSKIETTTLTGIPQKVPAFKRSFTGQRRQRNSKRFNARVYQKPQQI